MRRILVSIILSATCWGCDSTQPSVATSVSFSPASLSFDAGGLRDTLVAVVLDQRGNAMQHVPVTWSVEGSAVTVAALGRDSAVVTSVGNGTALIRAAAEGGAGGEIAATVTQAPYYIEVVGGNGQATTVGEALPSPIRVVVKDRIGFAIRGIDVTFEVLKGDGTLTASTLKTGEDGTASVGWTLGTIVGPRQELAVSAAGLPWHLVVTASGLPGPPHSVSIARGDGQIGAVDTNVPIAPAVFVQDRYGNASTNAAVTFRATGGGGKVPRGNVRSEVDGIADTPWYLGPTPGPNSLRAELPEFGLYVDFAATAISPLHIDLREGGNQAGRAGEALPVPLSIIVRNKEDEPIGGVPISFQVLEGGGSVANISAVTNADGIASAGAWTLGPEATRNRIVVTGNAPTLEKQSLGIDAYGCSAGSSAGFSINLCYLTNIPTWQRPAFEAAADRWGRVIAGDLPDVNVNLAAPCGDPANVQMVVDDLLIFVSTISIDGIGGVLGRAAPCWIRGSGGLPHIGVMEIDQADAGQVALSTLESVVLHEMAHVMGIGSLWDLKGLLGLPSAAGVENDTYFSGANAIEAFDAVGGVGYTGRKVPVENSGGSGTRNSHWRESVFRNELMTGYINLTANPLSLVTIRSLEDLGYVVDLTRADPYVYGSALRREGAPGPGIPVGDDVLDIPLWRTDGGGREVRVR